MSVLQGLEPTKFFYFFEEISNIPRCSYNEQQVSDYIANFAKKRGLDYFQDEIHNTLVKKPGTPGYERAPALIFHGHTDIVCEKDEGVEHDFSKGLNSRSMGILSKRRVPPWAPITPPAWPLPFPYWIQTISRTPP